MENIIVVEWLGVDFIDLGDIILVSEECFLRYINE